jgi:putative endonuclease
LGKRGEIEAVKYLKKQGYKIIDKNYRAQKNEADIIAYENNVLVFIEVKTRTNENYGRPCEAVGLKKQNGYIEIAKEYIYKNKLEDIDVRFDIIEILNNEINHIKNAYNA